MVRPALSGPGQKGLLDHLDRPARLGLPDGGGAAATSNAMAGITETVVVVGARGATGPQGLQGERIRSKPGPARLYRANRHYWRPPTQGSLHAPWPALTGSHGSETGAGPRATPPRRGSGTEGS